MGTNSPLYANKPTHCPPFPPLWMPFPLLSLAFFKFKCHGLCGTTAPSLFPPTENDDSLPSLNEYVGQHLRVPVHHLAQAHHWFNQQFCLLLSSLYPLISSVQAILVKHIEEGASCRITKSYRPQGPPSISMSVIEKREKVRYWFIQALPETYSGMSSLCACLQNRNFFPTR